MSESREIIDVPSYEIGVMREPKAVLAEAKIAAQALMTVVSQKPKPVIMNGEQYLEFEDWQTVAKFYGLTAKVVKTTFIDLGGVKGFEATAEAIRVSDGMAVSSADAMCLNDEDKWSMRTKYEYEDVLVDGRKVWIEGKGGKKGYYKSEKKAVGEVPVPLFQLRSMAQTRACAKALRNVLAWVVVLAGFKPSVAEEMTGDEEPSGVPAGKPAVEQPKEKAIEYADIITLSQGKIGDILNISGYGISVKHSQVGAKKTDISEYLVSDLPTNPTSQLTIKAWGKPLDVGKGALIKFNGVTIGDYKGARQYTANEAVC